MKKSYTLALVTVILLIGFVPLFGPSLLGMLWAELAFFSLFLDQFRSCPLLSGMLRIGSKDYFYPLSLVAIGSFPRLFPLLPPFCWEMLRIGSKDFSHNR